MSNMPRRYSMNNNLTRLKITPSLGSNKGKGEGSSEKSNEENTSFSAAMIRRKKKKTKSEMGKSVNLNLMEPAQIITKRNYMSLESDELEDRNIIGRRKTLAMMMQSHIINISIVALIITY